MTCNDVSSNPAIETPQVTVVPEKKGMSSSHNNTNNHLPIIIIVSAVASALLLLITLSLSLLLYLRNQSQLTTTQLTYSTSKTNLRARLFVSCFLFLIFYVSFLFLWKITGVHLGSGKGNNYV